jgi:hypothetical protein
MVAPGKKKGREGERGRERERERERERNARRHRAECNGFKFRNTMI